METHQKWNRIDHQLHFDLHQILSITDISFEQRTIIGFVELTILSLHDNIRYVKLNLKQCQIHRLTLNDEFEITKEHIRYFDPFHDICKDKPQTRSLEDFSKQHLAVAGVVDPDNCSGELIIVVPPQMSHLFAEGRQIRIGIEFSLEKPNGGIHFVPAHNRGPLRERNEHLYTYGYQNSSRLWFPCIDRFAETCTWRLEFTVDKDMRAVSNGDLIETIFTPDLQRKTFYYKLDTPTSAPNISLAVGSFEPYFDPNNGHVIYFSHRRLFSRVRATTRYFQEIFEFFERMLSTHYPYSRYNQVFVDQTTEDYHSYATVTILSINLLYFWDIIDQVYITRLVVAQAIAEQFFGCFISIQNWSDMWLIKGISRYLCGLYQKAAYGNDDYSDMIHNTLQDVLKYEEKYGGIILDPTPPPDSQDDIERKERFYFSLQNSQTLSPLYITAMYKKAAFVIRMIEKRIGEDQLMQVFKNQLSSVANAEEGTIGSQRLISTNSFAHAIFAATGEEMDIFMNQWVRTGGHAKFNLTSVFNRNQNTIELKIKQETAKKSGIRRYCGPLLVVLQELDGSFGHLLQIQSPVVRVAIKCQSKTSKDGVKEVRLSNGHVVRIKSSANDSPVLWIRPDPDMTFPRSVGIEQREDQWQNELRYECEVVSQFKAIAALESFPSPATKSALIFTIENEACFYKVRCRAAHCLTNVANALNTDWVGPPPMLEIFCRMFGSSLIPHIVRPNDFTNLDQYSLQKTIPVAMAGLRNWQGVCPPEVVQFLLDLIQYNDNSMSDFSDVYYRASLVEALRCTLSPGDLALSGWSRMPVPLNPKIEQIIDEVRRRLQGEQFWQNYTYAISVACLKTLKELEKCGYAPSQIGVFRGYAAPGNHVDLRMAALECLVDFVRTEGSFDDLEYLLDVIKNDPEPGVRHKLVELMIENPPFKRAQGGRFDRPPLAQKLWSFINDGLLAHNTTLRCSVVDLYYTLYGTKTPVCLTITYKPENQIPLIPEHILEQEMVQIDLDEKQELVVGLEEIKQELVVGLEEKQELLVGSEEMKQELPVGSEEMRQELVVGLEEMKQELPVGSEEMKQELPVILEEIQQELLVGLKEKQKLLVGLEEIKQEVFVGLEGKQKFFVGEPVDEDMAVGAYAEIIDELVEIDQQDFKKESVSPPDLEQTGAVGFEPEKVEEETNSTEVIKKNRKRKRKYHEQDFKEESIPLLHLEQSGAVGFEPEMIEVETNSTEVIKKRRKHKHKHHKHHKHSKDNEENQEIDPK